MKVIFKCERFRAKSGKEAVSMINETGAIDLLIPMTPKIKKDFGSKEIIFVETDYNVTIGEVRVIKVVNHF